MWRPSALVASILAPSARPFEQPEREDDRLPDPFDGVENAAGWRATDFASEGPRAEGFVPVEEAAYRMGVSEDEVLDMAWRSLLAARVVNREVWIRPAIVDDGGVMVVIDGEPTTCEVCGVPFIAVRFSEVSEAPRLCDLHASIRQQAEERRAQAGGSPPPEAFREVVLDERWRGE